MFYAYYNAYGNGTRHADDNDRIGHLRIFESAAERDEWVSADVWDGSYHREALTYREALPYLVAEAVMYSGEFPEECRARGAKWMCSVVLSATREEIETAHDAGTD